MQEAAIVLNAESAFKVQVCILIRVQANFINNLIGEELLQRSTG